MLRFGVYPLWKWILVALFSRFDFWRFINEPSLSIKKLFLICIDRPCQSEIQLLFPLQSTEASTLFVTVSFTDLAVCLLPFLVRMSVRQSLAPPLSCLWTRHGSDHWHCLGWSTIRSLREFKGVMSACLWGTFLSSVSMKEKNYRSCMKFIPSCLIKCNMNTFPYWW